MIKHEQFASVWDALCDTPEEAANMTLCSDLMIQIGEIVKAEGWSNAEAARRSGVSEVLVVDLLKGHIDKFSLNSLVNIAVALGRKVRVEIEAA